MIVYNRENDETRDLSAFGAEGRRASGTELCSGREGRDGGYRHYKKLSTCLVFTCRAATRLYASTAFSNGTTSIDGGFKAPVFEPQPKLVLDFRNLPRR